MPSNILNGSRILVVEDELLLAMDLEDELISVGAKVVGPVASVDQALELLRTGEAIDGAVLDLNLAGELCYPIADELTSQFVPFVLSTGYETVTLLPQFRGVPHVLKPVAPSEVCRKLGELLAATAE